MRGRVASRPEISTDVDLILPKDCENGNFCATKLGSVLIHALSACGGSQHTFSFPIATIIMVTKGSMSTKGTQEGNLIRHHSAH